MARFFPSSWWVRTSWVLLLLVLLPLLGLSLTFHFVPAFRESVLTGAISRADAVLPGDWTFGRTGWPRPGRLEIEDFLWTRDADTLAAADRLILDVDLGDLVHRRLNLRKLEVVAARADIPALKRAFPGGGSGEPDPEKDEATGKWPVRAIECDSLRVEVTELRTDPDSEPASGRIVGGFEVGLDRAPRVELREVSASMPAWGLAVGPGSLSADATIPIGEGTLPIRWKDGGTFEIRATVDETRHLVLAVDAEEAFGTNARAALRLGPEAPDRRRPLSVDLSMEVLRPERLAGAPGFPPSLAQLPPGSRLTVAATGHAVLPPEPAVDVDLRVTSTLSAVDSAGAHVAWSAEGTQLRDLVVRGEGLSLTGHAGLGASEVDLDLEARVTSLDAMRPFAEPPGGILPLDVTVRVSARGPASAPQADATITGSFGEGSARVDSLDVQVQGDVAGDGAVTVDLAAFTSGVWFLASGERTDTAPLTVETGPWRVATEHGPAATGPRGRLVVDDGSAELQDLAIDGVLGEFALSGTWSEREGADVAVDARWPTPPPEELLPSGSRARIRALAATWADGGAPELQAHGTVSPDSAWTLDSRFLLPGPRRLVPDAPDGVDLSGLESIRGHVTASGRDRRWNAVLDLAETEWLDEAVLHAHAEGDSVQVDSLRVDAFGVRVAGGAALADSVDGQVELDVDSLDPLRARFGALPEDLALALAATATLTGLRDTPTLHVEAAARGEGPGWRADGVKLSISTRGAALESLQLTAVDSLVVRGYDVRVAEVEIRPFQSPSDPDSTALLGSVHVESDLIGIALVAGVTQSDGWRVAADTLSFRYRESDLRAKAPFVASFLGDPRTVTVEGLDLEGSMGTLSADGRLDPQGATFRIDLDLLSPLGEDDRRPWPRRLAGSVVAARRDSVDVDLTATGFPPARRPTATALTAQVGPGGTTASVIVSVEDTEPVRADVRAPVVVDLVTARVDTLSGSWSADVELDHVTVPLRFDSIGAQTWIAPDEGDRVAFVTGTASLAGPPHSPTGSFDGTVDFPRGSNLRDREVEVSASLETPGLSGHLRWSDAGTSTAEVDASFPEFRLGDDFRPDLGSTLDLRVRENDFPLSDLDPFLSPGTHVQGRLSCDVHVTGSPEDAALEGWLEASDVEASDSHGDRAIGKGRIEFGGTLAAPKANGRLELSQGRINIPEPNRTLLDERGRAMLWSDPPPGQAPPDSTVAAPIESLDLGIDVSIPGSLILRGRGLDLNLSGELSLVLVNGHPRVEGELQATSGSLAFLGTRFEVDSGRAVFYGGETIDPTLDLVLSRQKDDVRAIVHITGRSSAPRLRLSSEPPMEEADILSQVLFGRGSSDLDGAETGFLQTQTAAALRMFAMPEVERELGARLGLDVVQLDAQGPESDELSLTVGKYLSSRALLQVDQGLERVGDSALRLEYWLTRHLKLETITSRQSHSGMELNWTKDY